MKGHSSEEALYVLHLRQTFSELTLIIEHALVTVPESGNSEGDAGNTQIEENDGDEEDEGNEQVIENGMK